MSKKLLLKDAHIEGIRYFDVYRKQGGYQAAEKALKIDRKSTRLNSSHW